MLFSQWIPFAHTICVKLYPALMHSMGARLSQDFGCIVITANTLQTLEHLLILFSNFL